MFLSSVRCRLLFFAWTYFPSPATEMPCDLTSARMAFLVDLSEYGDSLLRVMVVVVSRGCVGLDGRFVPGLWFGEWRRKVWPFGGCSVGFLEGLI